MKLIILIAIILIIFILVFLVKAFAPFILFVIIGGIIYLLVEGDSNWFSSFFKNLFK